MTNYAINEAETIFEPLFDPTLNLVSQYQITISENAAACVLPEGCQVLVRIEQQGCEEYAVKMERCCKLDISGYDLFRLFAAIDPSAKFRIQCTVDGKKITVMEQNGLGDSREYDGKILGSEVTGYSLEFGLTENKPVAIALRWLGLANEMRQKEMENRKSPYDSSWEGCFAENPELIPRLGLYFGKEELESLRVRLNKEPFLSMTNLMRQKAKEAMKLEPEPYITDYLPRREGRFQRSRDYERPVYHQDMDILAFIGLLDQDMEMLRMACRKLLSIAVVPNWTESIMGNLPGTTWHHRSFTEADTCAACVTVLDMAGNILTSYGRSLVYDALVMKGLPRLEADFHTMEYIHHMNQGIVFNHGRILTLLALTQKYPRYRARLLEAEKEEQEMLNEYIRSDGGTIEGPHYWRYTFSHVVGILALLARYKGMTLEEYAWDKLELTGKFALTMLADDKDGTYILPFSDSHTRRYTPEICAAFCRISNDLRWKKLCQCALLDKEPVVEVKLVEAILLCAGIDNLEDMEEIGNINEEGFSILPDTGHLSLRRETEDVGRVHFYFHAGPSDGGHCHDDKGSFILEVNHVPLLIDRGVCDYSDSNERVVRVAAYHNLFMPQAPEGTMEFRQARAFPDAGMRRADYIDGVLDCLADTTDAWQPGILRSIKRRVKSADPHLYLIYDDAEFLESCRSSFRLHTRGDIRAKEGCWVITDRGYQITVTPINYTPQYAEYGADGVDENLEPVNSLKLFMAEAAEQHIVTLLEVSLAGAQKAGVETDGTIVYDGKEITW